MVEANPEASPQQLLEQMKVMTSGADYITLEMLRVRLLAPVRNLHPLLPLCMCTMLLLHAHVHVLHRRRACLSRKSKSWRASITTFEFLAER